mmetsp:Transcript_6310/g.13903  ORF Transcript_6310/g.13903 Transcript_6310/m.13903 type:complete len:81 (-) Transcript_6310:2306-2548(-)
MNLFYSSACRHMHGVSQALYNLMSLPGEDCPISGSVDRLSAWCARTQLTITPTAPLSFWEAIPALATTTTMMGSIITIPL